MRPEALEEAIPVMRPRLPSAEALFPYLHRIDASRVYSNFGPLAGELEERLASLLSLPAEGIVLAASGYAALVGTILATAGRAGARRLAVVPDHTFVATALAAEQCGYGILLADVDESTWALSPERLGEHPRLAEVGLVVPVTPYGRGVSQQAWLAFRERTGIPVVIDGAASLESACRAADRLLGPIPVALSFHATKSFATGEGGAAVSTDPELVARILRALNFGFYDSRDCTTSSFNGKMSEYHAAVGMAELDGWAGKLAGFQNAHDAYRRTLGRAGLATRFVGVPEIASCYALFQCADPTEAASVSTALAANRVGHRFWYGSGLHAQPHFSGCDTLGTAASQDRARCLIGLPMAPDLAESAIERVVDCLRSAIPDGA